MISGHSSKFRIPNQNGDEISDRPPMFPGSPDFSNNPSVIANLIITTIILLNSSPEFKYKKQEKRFQYCALFNLSYPGLAKSSRSHVTARSPLRPPPPIPPRPYPTNDGTWRRRVFPGVRALDRPHPLVKSWASAHVLAKIAKRFPKEGKV